jgi:hypothetical protein
MSRALLAFNPEAHRTGGETLLFGVSVPPAPRRSGLPPLEVLNLASQFLEVRSTTEMAALLRYIIHRATGLRRVLDPRVVGWLLHRLTRAATTVRGSLQSDAAGAGSPTSPEAIFGAELEGLSPEDREFEAARRFVEFADELTQAAARSALSTAPEIVAAHAERITARRFAPGLSEALRQTPPSFRVRRRMRLGQ